MATTTTIGTDLTTIGTARGQFAQQVAFQVENTGATAFDEFQVQARMSADASNWVAVASTTYTGSPSDTYPVWATADLTTLAGGSKAILQVSGLYYEVRLQASVASGTTTTTVYGLAQG
jgi:hypothetical protein